MFPMAHHCLFYVLQERLLRRVSVTFFCKGGEKNHRASFVQTGSPPDWLWRLMLIDNLRF